jgi:hypothetical protein
MKKKYLIDFLCHARRYFYRLQLYSNKYNHVKILGSNCGFFGNLFLTINGIRLCETARINAHPFWGRESPYFNETHGQNVWEYYFEPVVIPKPRHSKKTSTTIFYKPDATPISPCYPGKNIRETYAICIQQFVRLRKPIKDEIEHLRKKLFNGKHILGIHARFTDTVAGFEDRSHHRLTQYFDKIDHYSKTNPVDGIFVATDSLPALEQFRNRYNDKIIALDCLRSLNNISIHGHYDKGTLGDPYIKGLEVIRDAYLLANTSHLIRVNSRVTAFSLCLKPDLTFTAIENEKNIDLSWLNN